MSTPRILVVRAKPHHFDREDEFLDGLVSVGWPVGSSFDGKDRTEIGDLLSTAGWRTGMAISQIHNFVNLPAGSIILTPSTTTRDIHILVDSKPYIYRSELEKNPGNGKPWGNPHTIPATYLKTLPREAFPAIVQRALNAARKTVTKFDKYSGQICAVLAEQDSITRAASAPVDSDLRREVVDSLRELLTSSKEETRLQAALALKDLL